MSSKTYGRKKLLTDVVLNGDTSHDKMLIPIIIENALPDHNKNVNAYKINEQWYYNDTKSILTKNKIIRSDVNNKISFSKARSVVKMNNGYCFGTPFKYVSNEAEEEKQKQMQAFNKCLEAVTNNIHTFECAKNSAIFGIGYKLALYPTKEQVQNGIYFDIDSDIDNSQAFVVYSNETKKEPILGVMFFDRYILDESGRPTNDTETVFNCWTRWHQWKFIKDVNGTYSNAMFTILIDDIPTSVDAYPLKLDENARVEEVDIPLQEYERTSDRVSDFELSISLMNAINVLASCRIDSVQQNVDYVIKLRDIDVGEFDENGNNPVLERIRMFLQQHFLAVDSVDGAQVQPDIDVLDIPLNQSEVQTLQDFLRNELLEELQQPVVSGDAGKDTGIAVENRSGFRQFDNQASEITAYAIKGEKQFLSKLLEIGKTYPSCPFKNLQASDITIKAMRNRRENLATSTDTFAKMRSAGVNPVTAYAESGLVADITDTIKLDEEYKKQDLELQLKTEIERQKKLNEIKPKEDLSKGSNKKVDEPKTE